MRKTLVALVAAALVVAAFVVLNAPREHRPSQPGAAAAGAHGKQTAVAFPEKWIPDAAIAVLEIGQSDSFLDLVFDPELAKRLGPAFGEPGSGKWRQAIGTWMFRRHFEKKFGADWRTLIRRLTAGGATIALGPEKTVVAIIRGDDAAFVNDVHKELVAVAGRGARPDQQKVIEKEHDGTTIYSINGGKTFHTALDEYVLFSNKIAAIGAVLDARSGKGMRSILDLEGFKTAKAATSGDAVATLFVSPQVVGHVPFAGKQRLQGNPLGVLLLAVLGDAVQEDAWAAVRFDMPDGRLAIRLRGNGQPARDGPSAFAWPDRNDGALPNVEVPRQIAGLSLYRDLRHFYSNKDALFPERTSQLIFFENMMGIFFSGRDIAEDVMGAVDPHIRVVVAEQSYDPAIGTPSVRLPGFALVFQMRDPNRFGLIAEEAWQKMLGLVNFSRGQKAQPGLIIDRMEHGGVRYSCAYFSHADEKDKNNLDTRFNFRPSIARQGDFLIFSSTDTLVNDLIDHLKTASAKPVPACNGMIGVECSRLASLVEANRESMIRDNMVKKGTTRAQAEKSVAAIPAIARFLGDATMRTGSENGKVVADLDFAFGSKKCAAAGESGVAAANP